jgi:hypothetical protein
LFYLVFFVVGILGTYVVRSQLFVADDPAGTLGNLAGHEWLARLDIALELGITLSQAMTAIWLYRLFTAVDARAAGALAAFGMVNAAAILGSAAVLAAAFDVAQDPTLAAPDGAAASVQLLFVVSGHLWGVSAVFFGLWLVPMGLLVLRSGWLPPLLGRLLVVAGLGYVVSAFVDYLFPAAGPVVPLLQFPSVIGEFWIMAYLVLVGVRDRTPSPPAEPRSHVSSQRGTAAALRLRRRDRAS